eukprot:scaffold5181_cov62-Cyclotella_meneghiniana.AAC.2
MQFSTVMTMIVSAMGLNQATANVNGTYTLFGGADAGFCEDSKGARYTGVSSSFIGTENGGSCLTYPGVTDSFNTCSQWCGQHQTDKHIGMEIMQTQIVNGGICWACVCLFADPAMSQAPGDYKPKHGSVQPDAGTGPITSTNVSPNAVENCYTYTAATPAPTAAPITSAPITSAPNTLAPTSKPTTAGKSSKGTKTTKGPSAKSAKGSKRV